MSHGKGYIKLYRGLQDCWIWQDKEPFTKRDAWIDLLLSANHADKKIMIEGKLVTIKAGQFHTSILKLSEKWKWDRRKVAQFIKILAHDEMLTADSTTHGTTITIVNWAKYQVECTTDSTTDSTTDVQRYVQPMYTNKNDKNDKKNNIYIAHFEEAWKIYPKKKDKSRAFQCYMARINSGYSEDELLTATKNYAAECEKEGRPEKYIKNGSTFFGINEPFVDYLGTKKAAPVNGPMEYEIDNGDTHPQIPPYYGFPAEWFEGNEPVRDRFKSLKQVQNFSIGVTDDTIYSPDELWDKYILRKRGYEYEQQLGFNDCP